MSDSIFEIREYLDSDGKVNSHDVTDISKELEYMEKLVSSMQEQPSALNEEDAFIRELALLSQEKSLDDETIGDDFFETFEARETQVPVQKAPVAVKKLSGEKTKSSGGWGKGFLTQSKPAAKVAKTSGSTDSLAASTQKLSIDESNSKQSPSSAQPTTVPETVFTAPAPLKGILKHTTTTSTATSKLSTSTNTTSTVNTTSTANTPTTVSTPIPTTETTNSAFSGSILERAPTKTVTKLGTGSKGVILGGPRKNV